MTDNEYDAIDDELAPTHPPLDAIDSRWWFWIAAYPIGLLLFVPLVVIAAVLFFVPVIVVGPNVQPGPGIGILAGLVGLVFLALVMAVVLGSFILIVMLPIALYMDARAVVRANLEWTPDPLLYGLLGVIQIFVTPLVGIVVAVYYLYRRHEHVGVP